MEKRTAIGPAATSQQLDTLPDGVYQFSRPGKVYLLTLKQKKLKVYAATDTELAKDLWEGQVDWFAPLYVSKDDKVEIAARPDLKLPADGGNTMLIAAGIAGAAVLFLLLRK